MKNSQLSVSKINKKIVTIVGKKYLNPLKINVPNVHHPFFRLNTLNKNSTIKNVDLTQRTGFIN